MPFGSKWWLLYITAVVVQISTYVVFIYMGYYQGENVGRFKRAWYVVAAELFMMFWSLVIWRRFSRLRNHILQNPYIQDGLSAVVVFVLACSHGSFGLYYFLQSDEPGLINIVFFTCWAYSTYLFSMLFVCIIGRGLMKFLNQRELGRILLKPVYAVPPLQTLAFNANIQTLVCMALSALFTAYGFYLAHNPPVIYNVTVQIDKLPAGFEGMRVALLSDIHIGPSVGKKRVMQVVDMVEKLDPGKSFFARVRDFFFFCFV